MRYKLLIIVILVLWTAILYSNSFSAPFTFDDEPNIVDNASIKSLARLGDIWKFWPTRFIGIFTFACNYHFGRLDVFGYHAVNFIVHAASGILVWWFFLLVFSTPLIKKERIAAYGPVLAFLGALLFLSHPLQTEAVTYVFQRVASLAAFFYLLSLCLYVKSRLLRQSAAGFSRWLAPYLVSLCAGIAGMFTKENACTLPLTIILCEFFFFGPIKREKLKYIMPFLFTLLIVPIFLFVFKPQTFEIAGGILARYSRKAVSAYALTQLRVIPVYIRLLFFPLQQNLDYDYPLARSIFEFPVFTGAIGLSVILIIAARLFSRHRLLSFGIFWFFLTLLPESSIVPLGDFIFEHRLYLPMVGFCFFVVCGLYCCLREKRIRLTVIILFLLIIAYSAATYRRNALWQDRVALWSDTVNKSPHKPRPYVNRGVAFLDKEEYDKAIADFDYALFLDPTHVWAYLNRGTVFFNKGQESKAMADFNRVLELNPNNVEAYNNRGCIFKKREEYEKAILDFKQALRINPYFAQAYINLGNTYAAAGHFEEGELAYKNAIAIEPFSWKAYSELAVLYGQRGDYQKEIEFCRKAIELNPYDALIYVNLSGAYGKSGDYANAIKYSQKALSLDPAHAVAYNNLATAYFYLKDYPRAIVFYDKAIALGFPANPRLMKLLELHRNKDVSAENKNN